MPHIDEPRYMLEKTDDTAARMVQHLLRWPCDLIDAPDASCADFRRLQPISSELWHGWRKRRSSPPRKGALTSWTV